MRIQFATCERPRALEFLRKLYPSHPVEDTPEDAGPLLDLVQADKLRIQDPGFHKPAQVVPGKKFNTRDRNAMKEVCRVFHERQLAKKKKEVEA